jgi:tRNA nucleotidyltransferase (CCA-adding enzyme)
MSTATGWWWTPRPKPCKRRAFLPVGRDFPVFLHPKTREEYALARTERKTAPGLPRLRLPRRTRRDAGRRPGPPRPDHQRHGGERGRSRRPGHAYVIDPYGGQRDLQARVLRHVTRVCRRPGAHPARGALCGTLSRLFTWRPKRWPDAPHGGPRRGGPPGARAGVAGAVARSDGSSAPAACSRCCAIAARWCVLLPEVDRLWGVPQRADYHPEVDTGVHLMMVLDMSARLAGPAAGAFCLPVPRPGQGHHAGRCAAAPHWPRERSAKLLRRLCERWRVPVECRELAEVVAREHGNIHRSWTLAGGAAAPAGTLRRAAPAGALCRGAAGLRMRRARPAGLRRVAARSDDPTGPPATRRRGAALQARIHEAIEHGPCRRPGGRTRTPDQFKSTHNSAGMAHLLIVEDDELLRDGLERS